jgi:hypothetical protein
VLRQELLKEKGIRASLGKDSVRPCCAIPFDLHSVHQ